MQGYLMAGQGQSWDQHTPVNPDMEDTLPTLQMDPQDTPTFHQESRMQGTPRHNQKGAGARVCQVPPAAPQLPCPSSPPVPLPGQAQPTQQCLCSQYSRAPTRELHVSSRAHFSTTQRLVWDLGWHFPACQGASAWTGWQGRSRRETRVLEISLDPSLSVSAPGTSRSRPKPVRAQETSIQGPQKTTL